MLLVPFIICLLGSSITMIYPSLVSGQGKAGPLLGCRICPGWCTSLRACSSKITSLPLYPVCIMLLVSLATAQELLFFWQSLGRTGPPCSSLVLMSRPSKGNHHGAVPGNVSSYVERRRPDRSLLVQEILTHLGMSVSSASLEKSLCGCAMPCLMFQRDRKSLFLDI